MPDDVNPSRHPKCFGGAQVAVLLGLAVLVTALVSVWVTRAWLQPAPLEPVVLSDVERRTLEGKLDALQGTAEPPTPGTRSPIVDPQARVEPLVDPDAPGEPLIPELYSEDPAARVLYFTERELNGLIAGHPDLAGRLALHLSDDLVSATMLVTVPPDFPFLAGRPVRVNAGLGLRHEAGRPEVVLRGVSVMGVPLPEAWLGGLKGQDLVALYGAEPGFWRVFSDGVADLRVEDGRLRVELAE
ncbi:hypothetical protein B1C78_12170 [Thioalkalivibrio denitrificans]|uniref:Arginine N-succinyltransferase n=1 Tax=Thioalkalivibrio denitrificans TaxID=108003 RepID=A0A1V3NDT1_9GAMM|nr:hypothetical protein [Thioalkalivibrio denitrificans]OOG23144.1 hypothetical protein B1C78_12170 [Thioalkalivibrio denitrificans]